MASIRPFQPFAFKQSLHAEIERLIAPPYDVIGPEALAELQGLHPNNITHLTLPEGEGLEKYERAGSVLRNWISEGVLERRSEPALYPYTQTFAHPETGDRITRTGFIASLGLEPFSNGVVLPHERTLSGPREDRLSLMKTTDANLESIFGMYPDPDDATLNLLRERMETTEPMLRAEDGGGVLHELWEITDASFVNAMHDLLKEQRVYIVDGHHRYETALNYRNMRREADQNLPAEHPVDGIMIYLTPMSDPGLVLLPTHRVIHSVADFNFGKLVDDLSESFEILPQESPEDGFHALHNYDDRVSFLLLSGDRNVLAVLKPGIDPASFLGDQMPESVAKLDVAILHGFILEQMLGIDREAQETQKNLRYVKNTADAIAAAGAPDTQLVAAMNPPGFGQVEEVAESGEVMPQKSTYFYPKLASGLLINKLD